MIYKVEFEDVTEKPRETFYEIVRARDSQTARSKVLKRLKGYGLERKNIKILSARRISKND